MEKYAKKISVVVPVYNVKDFLEECIDSVISQTYPEWELILVDDGSIDGSWEICEKYSSRDNRIIAKKNEHGGVGIARNLGLDVAKGDYVTFLDSDDWLEENYFEKAIKLCEELEIDIFMGGYVMIKSGVKVCQLGIPEEYIGNYREVTSEYLKKLVEYNYCASCCGKIYKHSIIADVRFDTDLNIGEDLKFVFEVMKKNPQIYASESIVYNYRRGHTSLTYSVDEKKCKGVIETAKILFHVIEEKAFEHTEFESYVMRRYRQESVYVLGVVLHEKMNIKEKIGCIKSLLVNPKNNRVTLYPFIGFLERHFKK